MPITKYKLIYNAAPAITTDWYQLDTRRNDDSYEGALSVGPLSAGDVVIVEGTFVDQVGIDKSFLASLTPSDIVTIGTVTGATSTPTVVNITVPYTFIRIRKTGAVGVAKVQGVI
jgi:hypothetical protein